MYDLTWHLLLCLFIDNEEHHSCVPNTRDDRSLFQLSHQWEAGHLGQSAHLFSNCVNSLSFPSFIASPLLPLDACFQFFLLIIGLVACPLTCRRWDASSTCCVLSSIRLRTGPSYRSSTESTPSLRTTSSTLCITTSYVRAAWQPVRSFIHQFQLIAVEKSCLFTLISF